MNEQIIAINNFLSNIKSNNINMYKQLAGYNINPITKGEDIRSIRDYCADYVSDKLINEKYKQMQGESSEVISTIIEYQDQKEDSFIHINTTFRNDDISPLRDEIKLYIPTDADSMANDIKKVYDFLINNKISFASKISPRIRAELFVLRLSNVEDAKKVTDFYSEYKNLKGKNVSVNPFLPNINGIGVAKDTYTTSYNSFLADLLTEYREKHKDSNLDHNKLFDEFTSFVQSKSHSFIVSKDKFLLKTITKGLEDIKNNNNPLENMQVNYNVEYDHQLFNQYKREHYGASYVYVAKDGQKIDQYNDPTLYIKLQKNNCLQKIYFDSYGKSPEANYQLNPKIAKNISYQIDILNDHSLDENSNVKINFKDQRVGELLPYLYAQMAIDYKDCNTYRALEIMNVVKKQIIEKQANSLVSTYKNSKGLEMKSSYPIIKTGNGTIGIEALENGFFNLYLSRKDKIQKISNILITIDNDLINGVDTSAQEYRQGLANLLLDEERNARMIKERNGDFGIIEFDNKRKQINKFMRDKQDLLKLSRERQLGIVGEVVTEEESFTR